MFFKELLLQSGHVRKPCDFHLSGFIFPKGSCSSGKNTEAGAIKTINRIFGVELSRLVGVITGKKASENFRNEAGTLGRTAKKVQGSAMEHPKEGKHR